MVFSDVTKSQGLVQDINFLVNADENSYPLADKCRNINKSYDEVVSLILQADGRWEFDDSNATDLPIATTDLVANQADYGFDSSFLIVSRVEIKDQGGAWRALKPISQQDVVRDGSSLTDFLKGAGIPQYYDKTANSIFLYPVSIYSQSASLKVYFQRNISYFVPTDTTKTPGFNPQFHQILSVSAALDYATAKNLPQGLPHGRIPTALTTKLDGLKANLQTYYSRKSKDENLRIGGRRWKFF
jgi:hypothetical protein